jgi:hypothetical protein
MCISHAKLKIQSCHDASSTSDGQWYPIIISPSDMVAILDCASPTFDVHRMTKSPKMHFSKRCPVLKLQMTANILPITFILAT